ncbi:MAG: hypothetical protein JO011_18435 [Ktedonobacteraceae bacterium]|nr:hypothetical protein [Ktedonobacteraceae bacterium]
MADRSQNYRAVFVIPWLLVGISLDLFPFTGLVGLWVLVLVAGAGVQFGFSVWSALPGLYRDRLNPEDIATAEGLMLTAGGIGGVIIPVIFGVIQTGSGFSSAFLFGGIARLVFALLGFAAREPKHVTGGISEAEAVQHEMLPEMHSF